MARKCLIYITAVCLLLAGCAAQQKETGTQPPAETTVIPKEEASGLLCVGDNELPLKYAQVLAASQKNQYESAFGESIWQVDYMGGSFDDYLKDRFRTHIALFYVSACMATNRNIVISNDEERLVREAAKTFYDNMDEKDISMLELGLSDSEELFRSYLLAKKVYRDVTGSVKLDLSEDETRVIRLQEIRVSTENLDGEQKDRKLTQIAGALVELEAGAEFDDVAAKYAETSTAVYSATRESLSSAESKAAFALATGEISPVITLPNSYVIFKCVESFDKPASRLHRMELLQQMEDTGFKEQLNIFLKDNPLVWNEDAWKKLSVSVYPGPASANFYAVFEDYFGEDN